MLGLGLELLPKIVQFCDSIFCRYCAYNTHCFEIFFLVFIRYYMYLHFKCYPPFQFSSRAPKHPLATCFFEGAPPQINPIPSSLPWKSPTLEN